MKFKIKRKPFEVIKHYNGEYIDDNGISYPFTVVETVHHNSVLKSEIEAIKWDRNPPIEQFDVEATIESNFKHSKI